MASRRNGINNYPEEWLDCRALGHAWARKGVYQIKGRPNKIRVLQCARCKTKRRDRINASGIKVGTYYYDHPDGYRLPKTPRRDFTREQVRRVQVQVVPDLGSITDI